MNQILSSEDHTGFYTSLGFSLALFTLSLFPESLSILQIENADPLLMIFFNNLLTLTAFAGLLTGLLYMISPDRLSDIILKNQTMFESWRYWDLWRVTESWKRDLPRNTELQQLIAEIDRTVTNWNRVIWNPPNISCQSTVESSIDSPSIQKTIWKMKRRAGMGLLFILWALTLLVFFKPYEYPVENILLTAALIGIMLVGVLDICYTMRYGDAPEMVDRLQKVSFVGYANDALLNWQPIFRGRRDENIIDAMDRLKDAATDLERIITTGQWKRFESTYDQFLQEVKGVKLRVANPEQTLRAAWCGTFAEITLAKSKGKDTTQLKIWFENVLEVFRLTGELEKIRWSIIPDENNFYEPSIFFTTNIPPNLVYKERSDASRLLREAFRNSDDDEKANWINAAGESTCSIPGDIQKLFYSWACDYKGTRLTSKAYGYLITGSFDIQDTTKPMVQRIANADISLEEKEHFFAKVAGHDRLPEKIRNLAKSYSAKL